MGKSKHAAAGCPVARSENLLFTAVDDEAVIYDQQTKVAHALSPLAAAVYTYANGENTVAEIAELASYRLATQVSESDAQQAVEQLSALDLLEIGEAGSGLTRRDTLKVFGAVGAGAMLVSSVAAPFAMAAGVANNYLCGTYDGDIKSSSGTSLYPQVWSSVGQIDYSGGANSYTGDWQLAGPGTAGGPISGSSASDYDLGASCFISAPTGTCTYQSWQIPTADVSNSAQCETYGFYWNQNNNTWFANGPDTTGTNGVPGNTGGALCINNGTYYYNVPEGNCYAENYICVDSANVYDGIDGPGDNGQKAPTCKSGDTAVLLGPAKPTTYQWYSGTWSGGSGSEGIYQCLPCDGNVVGNSYQCCEVVCAPAGLGGVIAPTTWSPSTSQASGPGTYTESACQIWGGSFCSEYAAKWCTDNPCNIKGDCTS
jgi:hypothetical protein